MGNKFNANKHRSRHVYRYYSKKNSCLIKSESFLEYTHLCIFECNPNIVAYASQPESIHITQNGKNIRYSPDALVLYTDGSAEYIEIHQSKFTDDEFKSKIALFSEYTEQTANTPIRIVSELGLCPITRVNYQLISACKSTEAPNKNTICSLPTEITLDELIASFPHDTNRSIEYAYYLVATGFYTFNMSKLLQSNTTLLRAA
tara:strand:- start:4855 stop:5463 length:609 start_codon:yes stop_codon:yes gene_type:complete